MARLINFQASPGLAERNAAVEAVMVEGEELLVQGVIHPAIYWKSAVVLGMSALLLLSVTMLGIVLGIFGLMMLGYAMLARHFLLIALTNKRVLARYGIIQTDVVTINFSKIESVEMERMLPGHLFGYATVAIMGTGQRLIRIPFITNAGEFRREFDRIALAKE